MNWNDMVIEQFRAGAARVADTFDRDVLLLLHTTGARTGEPRVSPLAHFDRGDHLVLAASAAGSDRHPAWYHNLVATPRARVERWVGDELRVQEVDAQVLTSGAERDRYWAEITAAAPGFADYQTRTDRTIPVVLLRAVG